jgi:predicted phage terminase large subunit-like protein
MLEFLDHWDRLEKRLNRAFPEQTTERSSPFADVSLADFIPAISRKYETPHHLARLLQLFERIRAGECVRVCVATPPRHGKTETLIHGIPWLLANDPTRQIAYISYAQRFAEKKSRKARDLARRAGVPLAVDSQSKADWRTGIEDGGVSATSIGGQLTGEGFHLMIVDDPNKDRATAESPVYREHQWEWFNDTAYTRLEPEGSCIVNMARWHPEDISGRLIAQGWEYINLQAISESGEALWPERWPVAKLEPIREQLGGEQGYGWSSLYQGAPRGRGGRVFNDVYYYDFLPAKYRVGIGVDLAYTKKTSSDWSVAVVLAESDGMFYVIDVVRRQCAPPEFAASLRALKASHPGAQMLWYTSTTEKGLADLLRSESGIPVVGELATADKFVRAQPVAAAWNATDVPQKPAKVLLPAAAPWLADFVSEVTSFTGLGDRHDDQVDALAAAYDCIVRGNGLARPTTTVSKFTSFGGNPFAGTGAVKFST